jgi:hypothetical protein
VTWFQRVLGFLPLAAVAIAFQTPAWRVTLRSAGPIRFGMTIEEARKALHDSGDPPSSEECDYWSPDAAPDSVHFLTEGGRVMRIDVLGSSVPTGSGAHVGDPEDRIKSLYGDRLHVEPHPYTDGHNLVFVPRDPADTAYRIVFETNGKIVTRYRAGLRPTVEYIEGCS